MNPTEIYKLYIQKEPRICIDSRSKEIENSVFFAIKGTQFDGNNFAEEAIKKGAKIAIVDNKKKLSKYCILVADVLKTLQTIAKIHRQKYNIPIIGITGSNGKTTTKNMLTTILASEYNTMSTQGNFNNHIGVPLSILSLREEHEIGVIEMGANHIGEIQGLCEIVKPTHGIITSIGDAHIGEFGSKENIIKAKNELFKYVKKNNGWIIYNANDPILKKLINNYTKTITYQIPVLRKKPKKYVLKEFEYQCNPFIEINHPNLGDIKTQILGKYNIHNIISAITIADLFQVPKEAIKKSLKNLKLRNNRSEFIETDRNTIILDAYNANPTSMSSGVVNFIEIYQYLNHEKVWFILGDMLELGDNTIEYHQAIIEILKKNNIQNCILVGELFNKIISENYQKVKSIKECIELVSKLKINNASIFIKGSRSLKLEKIVSYL